MPYVAEMNTDGLSIDVEDHRLTDEQAFAVRNALLATFFKDWSPDLLASTSGQAALNDHVRNRYEVSRAHVVPWVSKHLPLEGRRVLEIGCGTGSSTAAFAQQCAGVEGYDIDEVAIEGARRRMEILGIENVRLHFLPSDQIWAEIERRYPDGVDAVLFYAVLEHQTFDERIDSLQRCWTLLNAGGALIVTDTPNRLTYGDYHTSHLPFYHVLPHDMAVAYADRSPRPEFVEAIEKAAKRGQSAAEESVVRWGRGVSYHDFELALGDLGELVVGDGFDPEMLEIKPVTLEEELLYTYWCAMDIRVPVGFVRQAIDVILRKPGGEVSAYTGSTSDRLNGIIRDLRHGSDPRERLASLANPSTPDGATDHPDTRPRFPG
jgi:S-adenosylmethionine-dependent methyltransferase